MEIMNLLGVTKMQNDMRDRLAELLSTNLYGNLCDHCGADNDFEKYKLLDMTADYLIANGVIVPPCKVGDTVYVISRYYTGTWKIYSCTVEYITYYKSNGFINAIFSNHINFGVNITEFGKTVFLNKEQAEQKLKELVEDNEMQL